MGFLDSVLNVGLELGGQFLTNEASQNALELQIAQASAQAAATANANAARTSQLITFGVVALIGLVVYQKVIK